MEWLFSLKDFTEAQVTCVYGSHYPVPLMRKGRCRFSTNLLKSQYYVLTRSLSRRSLPPYPSIQVDKMCLCQYWVSGTIVIYHSAIQTMLEVLLPNFLLIHLLKWWKRNSPGSLHWPIQGRSQTEIKQRWQKEESGIATMIQFTLIVSSTLLKNSDEKIPGFSY